MLEELLNCKAKCVRFQLEANFAEGGSPGTGLGTLHSKYDHLYELFTNVTNAKQALKCFCLLYVQLHEKVSELWELPALLCEWLLK